MSSKCFSDICLKLVKGFIYLNKTDCCLFLLLSLVITNQNHPTETGKKKYHRLFLSAFVTVMSKKRSFVFILLLRR